MEKQEAMRLHWSIIVLSAAFLGKYAYEKIVTVPQHNRQHSINNFCTGILDNLIRIERRSTTMNLSAAYIGKYADDDIASAI
jgi:hypothetical protein